MVFHRNVLQMHTWNHIRIEKHFTSTRERNSFRLDFLAWVFFYMHSWKNKKKSGHKKNGHTNVSIYIANCSFTHEIL